jgi:hypothetical protein
LPGKRRVAKTPLGLVQVLQDTVGYDEFEKRRQAKFSKAIGGNAMLGRDGVDEGVDVQLK